MRRRLIGATLAASASLVLVTAAPAAAAPTYTTITHTDTTGVALVAGGSAAVESDGLRIKTPADPDQVTFYVDLFDETGFAAGNTVPIVYLSFVADLSYKTIKHDTGNTTLPAYKLELYCNSDHTYTTLVFEPYLQTPAPTDLDQWQTWDVFGGTFWSSKDLGGGYGGPGDHSDQRDIEAILELCGQGAFVLSYQVGQGTFNAGVDATTDAVRFAGESVPIAQPSVSKVAVDADVAIDVAVDGTPIADEHIWRKPADPTIGLPQTGFAATWYVLIGAGLVVAGALIVLLTRRRRTA